MTFYEKYVMLCSERNMKPQNPEMQAVAGVSSASISGWKKGAEPRVDVIIRLARYFDVTADYLIGLSELRKPDAFTLSDHETILLKAFNESDAEGQQNIIYICQHEMRKNIKKGDDDPK